jgi:hypothetical protein
MCREDGRLIIDFPKRKVMIYPNEAGSIVLMCEEDDQRCFVMIEVGEIDAICAALVASRKVAAPIAAEMDAQYETFQAIEKARGE